MTDTLTARAEIRCTPAERDAWAKTAAKDSRTPANWMRLVLNRATRTDLQVAIDIAHAPITITNLGKKRKAKGRKR